MLTKVKAKLNPNNPKIYQEGLTVLDNFLANNNYYTNSSSVLALLKDPWYQEHLKQSQPNLDSDRFVEALLTDSKLLSAWQTALSNAINGKPTDAAEQFLKAKGYSCNAAQVKASFLKMRDQKLGYWSGIYGAAVLTFSDGDKSDSKMAPVLIVYGDDKLGFAQDKLDWELNKVQYSMGVLEWQPDDFGTITHSGKITFNHVSIPSKDDPYVGSEFFGTIIFTKDDPNHANKTASIMGRIGKLPTDKVPPGKTPKTPPTVDLPVVDKIVKYTGYAMAGFFIVDVLLVKLPSGFKSAKEFFGKIKDKFSSTEESVNNIDEQSQEVEDSVSEVKDLGSPIENLDRVEFQDPNDFNDNGLDGISDKELPPAESVEDLEAQSENISEKGKFEQNPEEVESSSEGEGLANDEVGEPESLLSELGKFEFL